jgi:hypothetical protein
MAYHINKLSIYNILILAFYISTILNLICCKKLIEINPPETAATGESVYAADATAAAVLTGIYTNLSGGLFATGQQSISLLSGLSSDELSLYSNDILLGLYYTNKLSSKSYTNWASLYKCILTANSAIEGMSTSQTLTPSVKQQLLGEARFIRAFCHFYLVNLFGDIPLVTTSDYRINEKIKRSSIKQVYQQIILDLREAQILLRDEYVGSNAMSTTKERVRPNKYAATALLARVFLYDEDWKNAEVEATSIINNTLMYNLNTLNDVFQRNSNEAIWQLQPIIANWNTTDARMFILNESGPNNSDKPVYLSNSLMNSFEWQDNRKKKWIDSVTLGDHVYYYPYKYKVGIINQPVTEYLMVLRLAEQYLIRAEAKIHQDDILNAQHDINIIRTRAGLSNTIAVDKMSLSLVIEHERKIEFFSEWGHRWLDLKRWKGLINKNISRADEVLDSIKTGWKPTDVLYPIPLSDIQVNSALTQNNGY